MTVYTADSNGNIENYQTNIGLSTTTAGAFAYIYANITENFVIGSLNSTIAFSINTTNPIPEGGYIKVAIPSTLTLTQSPPYFSCIVGCDSTTSTVIYGTNTVTVTGLFPTGYYAASGTNI